MKTIHTDGITYIEPVPEGTPDWYYGLSSDQGDLYEAEEIFLAEGTVRGNEVCLIHYPDGEVFRPFPKSNNIYFEKPVFWNDCIFLLQVDFADGMIRIFRFGCRDHAAAKAYELPLDTVRNCFNLQLHVSPLSLTRQGDEGNFEIIFPEKVCFPMDPHESFFLRQDGRLYFSRWFEEGEGPSYRYWESTVVRDLSGRVIETLPGDIRIMPNGEMWHLK